MLIPDCLKWLERNESGKLWLADLPRLVADLARESDLELGPPYEAANVSYVAPVARGAERMVLKVQWPHDECRHEADALLTWNGDGAVRFRNLGLCIVGLCWLDLRPWEQARSLEATKSWRRWNRIP